MPPDPPVWQRRKRAFFFKGLRFGSLGGWGGGGAGGYVTLQDHTGHTQAVYKPHLPHKKQRSKYNQQFVIVFMLIVVLVIELFARATWKPFPLHVQPSEMVYRPYTSRLHANTIYKP